MSCRCTVISSIKTAQPEDVGKTSLSGYIFRLLIGLLMVALLTACDQSDQGRVTEGQITGNVVYHQSIKGDGLQDRDLVVWLPPGYDTEPGQRYPVLYMHDGQNIFDPETSYAGVDWAIDEAVDGLIRAGTIEPMIVVGIYNSKD